MSSLTDAAELEEWLALSPDHFYMRYQFDSLNPETWNQRQGMPKNEDFLVCQSCWRERLREKKLASQFSAYSEREPLPTLDLFGGVGAFSKGLAEGSECLRVTHAVEIGPSAAKTFEYVIVLFVYIMYFPELLTDEIHLVPLFIINARIPCSVMRSSFVKVINLIHLCSYLMERHQSLHLQNPAKSK
jgi:hypothetical protein